MKTIASKGGVSGRNILCLKLSCHGSPDILVSSEPLSILQKPIHRDRAISNKLNKYRVIEVFIDLLIHFVKNKSKNLYYFYHHGGDIGCGFCK